MLERRGVLELDPILRLALFAEAARLHEERGDLAMAIAAWQSGREGDESNLQALDELARLYEKAGNLDGLVEALTDKSHVIEDNAQRAGVAAHVSTGLLMFSMSSSTVFERSSRNMRSRP